MSSVSERSRHLVLISTLMEKSIKENTYYFCALMNSSPFWTELCIVMESCKDNFAFILENGNTGAHLRGGVKVDMPEQT